MIFQFRSLFNTLTAIVVVGTLATMCFGADGKVLHVAQTPAAKDSNPGTAASPFRTINQAAQLAQPGDTVVVHEGVYREWVRPARGGTGLDAMIQYKAGDGEKVVVSGSEIFSPNWTPVSSSALGNKDFVRAEIPSDYFGTHPRLLDSKGNAAVYNPFTIPVRIAPYEVARKRFSSTSRRKVLPKLVIADVYVRGKSLRQVRTIDEAQGNSGTWCVAANGTTLYVHFCPFTSGPVELTVRPQVFAPEIRGLGYISVSGFIFEHAANQGPFPQAGMVSTRSGHHWLIENNVIRYAATIGLDVGSEWAAWAPARPFDEGPWLDGKRPSYDEAVINGQPTAGHHIINADAPSRNHIVRGNIICDNGLSGIAALKADDLLIENNIIERNNRRLLSPSENTDMAWEEAAGVKLHMTKRAILRDNLIRDQYGEGRGIWLDNNNDAARVSSNLILGNYCGVDLEINAGPTILVDNNIVAFNRLDGLAARDSTTVRFVQNLIVYNGRWGAMINYTGTRGNFLDRHFTRRPVDCEISNNILSGNQYGAIRVPIPLPGESGGTRIDGNLIGIGQLCQLESGGVNGLNSKDMIELVKKQLGADSNKYNELFKKWQIRSDWWFLGECDFDVLNRIMGGKDNHCQKIDPIHIFELCDRFKTNDPVFSPMQLSCLSPQYMMTFDAAPAWEAIRVTPVSGVEKDYFGHPMPVKDVMPGPFQNVIDMNSAKLVIWPRNVSAGK